jgi:ADP-ribose pyrophosphatase YjhB (NUDIX family)
MITAQVVLLNKEGLVLGVSRKNDHNDMGLAGGKMEIIDNNDPIATAIRECKEETGLDVSNLRLIFAIHKNGNMGYTYLADYEGEINHNEPHLVKWVPFQLLINGSFGKYNKMVSESLTDMEIPYQLNIDEGAMEKEVDAYFKVTYDGEILFSHFYKNTRHSGSIMYDIHVKYPDDSENEEWELEDGFDVSDEVEEDLKNIGLKYGVYLSMSIDYSSK